MLRGATAKVRAIAEARPIWAQAFVGILLVAELYLLYLWVAPYVGRWLYQPSPPPPVDPFPISTVNTDIPPSGLCPLGL